MLQHVFEQVGYAVDGAADGREGLNLYRHASYNLVLTDIELPDMTGADLIQEIRRHTPTAKIIAMSGRWPAIQPDDDQLTVLLGADQVIAKPFDLAKLRNLVRCLLDRSPSPFH